MSDKMDRKEEREIEAGKLADITKAVGALRASCDASEEGTKSDRIYLAIAAHLDAEVQHFRKTRMKFDCVNILVALGDEVEKFKVEMGHSTLDEAHAVALAILEPEAAKENA